MSMEDALCRLLHCSFDNAMQQLEGERGRLLSLPLADERELRRALRGIELRMNALATTFQREHPLGEGGTT
jgi:hypothetical protein